MGDERGHGWVACGERESRQDRQGVECGDGGLLHTLEGILVLCERGHGWVACGDGSSDKTVKVWNVETGELLHTSGAFFLCEQRMDGSRVVTGVRTRPSRCGM